MEKKIQFDLDWTLPNVEITGYLHNTVTLKLSSRLTHNIIMYQDNLDEHECSIATTATIVNVFWCNSLYIYGRLLVRMH